MHTCAHRHTHLHTRTHACTHTHTHACTHKQPVPVASDAHPGSVPACPTSNHGDLGHRCAGSVVPESGWLPLCSPCDAAESRCPGWVVAQAQSQLCRIAGSLEDGCPNCSKEDREAAAGKAKIKQKILVHSFNLCLTLSFQPYSNQHSPLSQILGLQYWTWNRITQKHQRHQIVTVTYLLFIGTLCLLLQYLTWNRSIRDIKVSLSRSCSFLTPNLKQNHTEASET